MFTITAQMESVIQAQQKEVTVTAQMESVIQVQQKENPEELKQQLLFAKLELDLMKMEMIQNRQKERELHEELKRIREDVKLLWQLLEEAKNERSMLLALLQMPSHVPAEANSSVTQTNNYSIGPSMADSSFETLFYPHGSSNSNQIISGNLGFVSSGTLEIDPLDAEIYSRFQLKYLPQKGKLLEVVKESSARYNEAKLLMSQPPPDFRNLPPLQSMKFEPSSGKAFGTLDIKEEPVFAEQQFPMFFDG